MNKSLVKVIRYFRPSTPDGGISNLGGMTARCELNYELNMMCVFPSFCMVDDNFDKQVGLTLSLLAEQANHGFAVPMDKTLSIKGNILKAIKDDKVIWLNKESREKFNAPFTRAYKDYLEK